MQAQEEKSEQSEQDKIQQLQRQIDELTAANFLLQEQQAQREQLTAMIAHDLLTPLAPIINYAQMLARHSCGSIESATIGESSQSSLSIARYTNIIISQARRMQRLINDLLDASLLANGQFSLHCTPCDIKSLTQEMVEQLRPVAPYHTLLLQAPDIPIIGNWDSGRLQQALGNLLDNAIKYSDEQSTITVTITPVHRMQFDDSSVHAEEKDWVSVSVHNQGVSIPAADVGQIFRPYTRLSPTGKRRGSGLGLFITKLLIEAHHGTLLLQSQSEEGCQSGATFTFELPLGDEK